MIIDVSEGGCDRGRRSLAGLEAGGIGMIEAVCEMGIGRALFLHRGFLDVDNDAVVGAVAGGME